MSDQKSAVGFEDVERAASQMLLQNIKPTVRLVMNITGGKTETVSGYLRDFFDKRDLEVSKLANELGSGEVAKLLASEIKMVVDRKGAALSEIVERQKEQINELVELMKEKESECLERVREAESERDIQVAQAVQRTDKAIKESEGKVKLITEQSNEQVAIHREAANKAEADKEKAESQIESAEQKAGVLIDAARADVVKLEKTVGGLRDQVKALAVDEAKREIERAQVVQMEKTLEGMRGEVSDRKTEVVKLQTEKAHFEKEVGRLQGEVNSHKNRADKQGDYQSSLIETQKLLSKVEHQLAQSERERESLSQALAVNTASNK